MVLFWVEEPGRKAFCYIVPISTDHSSDRFDGLLDADPAGPPYTQPLDVDQ